MPYIRSIARVGIQQNQLERAGAALTPSKLAGLCKMNTKPVNSNNINDLEG